MSEQNETPDAGPDPSAEDTVSDDSAIPFEQPSDLVQESEIAFEQGTDRVWKGATSADDLGRFLGQDV